MATQFISSFEVLANPIAPGVPNVPYVQQGYFLQLSNLGAASALVGVEFIASPAFVAAKGAIKLFTNIIDQAGMPQQVPAANFLSAPVGFEMLNIPAGATWLVGVQYLLLPPPAPIVSPPTGTTPQDAAMARGVVRLEAAAGTRLMLQATTRQVFATFDAMGKVVEFDSSAYPMDLAGGPDQTF